MGRSGSPCSGRRPSSDEGLDTLSHGVFWSLFLNVAVYLLVSVLTIQDADERSQAAAFVGVAETDPSRVPAILSVPAIEHLLHLYVAAEEADAPPIDIVLPPPAAGHAVDAARQGGGRRPRAEGT